VYLWDLDHGFAGVILIKKAGDGSKKIKGCWDSIHVIEVQVRVYSGEEDYESIVIVFLKTFPKQQAAITVWNKLFPEVYLYNQFSKNELKLIVKCYRF